MKTVSKLYDGDGSTMPITMMITMELLTPRSQFGIIGAGADFDGDGCKDSEDEDDDNDGFADDIDDCPQGMTGIGTDLDSDGCQDAEDSDIDGDGIHDFDLDPSEDTF